MQFPRVYPRANQFWASAQGPRQLSVRPASPQCSCRAPQAGRHAAGNDKTWRLKYLFTACWKSVAQFGKTLPPEAEVIACAQELGIGVVCIDEIQGRRIARLSGLRVTGSLGILLKLKSLGLIASVKPCVARMREHGIWLSAELEHHALLLAGIGIGGPLQ